MQISTEFTKLAPSVAEEELADPGVPHKACGQIAALILADFVDMFSFTLGCMLAKSCLVELTEVFRCNHSHFVF